MSTLYQRSDTGKWRVREGLPKRRSREFPTKEAAQEYMRLAGLTVGQRNVRIPIEERILRRVIEGPGGCWLWQGNVDASGYGHLDVSINGRNTSQVAHRASYEAFVGPVPEGLQLDHLCRVRACCNPAHLEPVTPSENVRRSPIAPAGVNAAKTHCPQGHPYDEANTYHSPTSRGGRQCRACRRERHRARRAALRMERAA